jgi:hypothetical protein
MPINTVPDGFEQRHILFDAQAHPDVRESLAFLLPLPEQGLGVIYYTWVHALGLDGQGRAGAALIVYGPALAEPVFAVHDNIGAPDDMAFLDWRVGPATMMLSDDMRTARLQFHTDDLVLDCTWQGINPSFGFVNNRNGCPSWLAWDRTEQGGRYVGTLRVGDITVELDHFGHRDHSWGMRDWGGPTHWKWWNIVGPDETAIHVMELQAFGRTTLHGYVHKDGITGTVLTMDQTIEFDDRMMHTAITATIDDDEGRTTTITTRQGADLVWPVSPYLTLHEASMHATIDGAPGIGYMEMAWPPQYVEHHRRTGPGYRRDQSALTLDHA